MLYYKRAEAYPLPEAGQFVLGKSLITLKARLIGIEDGEFLTCQQLWLIHLRDIGPLGSSRDRDWKAGSRAGTYCVRRMLFIL